ncbi:MAG: ferritin-like domain-containing protein [Candidatus Bathyarchaeia archaeon]|jgi:hypothetical protein
MKSEEKEKPIEIDNRSALIYTLSDAATLEHMVMCGYLFATFSLKREESERLSAQQLNTVQRWDRALTAVAVQEMLHLALVNNLLSAVGGPPSFDRPNFPQRSKYFPSAVQMVLLPFGEDALRHSLFLERPEGMKVEDAEALINAPAEEKKTVQLEGMMPSHQEFSSVGHLYRGIEQGIHELAKKYGERNLFVGSRKAQATKKFFGWDKLVPVSDVSSATAAIEEIIIEGEGARGDWKKAHFGKFLAVYEEYKKMRESDPDFEPARPVVPAYVRYHDDVTEPIVKISDPLTLRVADLFNSTYEIMLQLLTRFFLHVGTTPAELEVLANTAVDTMYSGIRPLGTYLTALPIGPNLPGKTAGPAFEIYRRHSYLIPHRRTAWIILSERLAELSEYCAWLKMLPQAPPGLAEIEEVLKKCGQAISPRAKTARRRHKN